MTPTEKTLLAHQLLNDLYGIQAIQGYSDPMHELHLPVWAERRFFNH